MTDGVNLNVAQGGQNVAKTIAKALKSEIVKKERVQITKLEPGEVEQGGIRFAKGVLKKGVPVKIEECREKLADGTFQTYKQYTATLVDGTVVTYREQPPINKNDGVLPEIKKNNDGSFDFIGLYRANIKDTPKDDMYNLLGCHFTHVDASGGNDKDKIDIANLPAHNSDCVRVEYNKGDEVTSPMLPFTEQLKVKEHDGYVSGAYGQFEFESESIGNGRKRETIRNGKVYNGIGAGETKRETNIYSHDGKRLKESYVNAKEQTLADGYKIKTSPDGKEQWFFAPDGKQISKETFRNRGL